MKPTPRSCSALAVGLLSFTHFAVFTMAPTHGAVTFDFNVGADGFTASSQSGDPGNPWFYSPTGGQGVTGGWLVDGVEFQSVKLLTSPTFVATGGAIMFGFAHRFSFEFNSNDAFDGGLLEVRINGGAFTYVPNSSLTGTGYTPDFDGVDGLGQKTGFSSTSAGYGGGSFVNTTAALGTFAPGDTVVVRFVGGWDESSAFASPNWVIDNVSVTGAVPEPGTLAFLGLAGLGLLRRRR